MQLRPYVEILGAEDSSNPNLVLIHGWGLHGGIWQPILPALEKTFRVFNVDLPGFGRSPVYNGEYSLDYLVESLEQVIPEECYVIGWSLGGLVATALALKCEKVKGLVTVASSPCFVSDKHWNYGMDAEVLNSFLEFLAEDFEGTLIRFLSIQSMGSPTQKEDITQLKETVFVHGLPAKKALEGGLRILSKVNLLPNLIALKVPFLRIYGKLDTLVPSSAMEQVAKYSPSSSSVMFQRSGHSPFLSESDKFVRLINQHLLEPE